MRDLAGVVVGLALLGLGLAILIDTLAPQARVFEHAQQWWPALLIVAGLSGVVRLVATFNALRGPIFVMLVGAVLLLVTLPPLQSTVEPWIWPAVLIVAGAAILTRLAVRQADSEEGLTVRRLHIATSHRRNWPMGKFSLAQLTVVASGQIVDLSKSNPLNDEARLDITAIASGVNLLVPTGWGVELDDPHVILGRYRPIAFPKATPGKPILEVHALLILAGLQVIFVSPDRDRA